MEGLEMGPQIDPKIWVLCDLGLTHYFMDFRMIFTCMFLSQVLDMLFPCQFPISIPNFRFFLKP